MPRNGGGVFSLPSTYEAISGEVIEAQQHNDPLEDLEQDANTARPIVAGGTGAITAAAAATALGVGAASAVTHASLTLTSTDAGATAGPVQTLYRDSASPTASDIIGQVLFQGKDSAANTEDYAAIDVQIDDPTSTSEDATIRLRAKVAGTMTTMASFSGARGFNHAPKGHLYGLTLSNNVSDATNDIDIAVGEAASEDANPWLMVLGSSLTKRLDASWAVGTGNGGLDTGSIANTTYFVWLIQRSDTGVVDALFSTSASSPTMPANYDRKRFIGPVVRASAAIVRFVQTGDYFTVYTPTGTANAALSTTSQLITLTNVPTGISVLANFDATVLGASANIQAYFSSPLAVDGTAVANSRTSLTTPSNAAYASGGFTLLTDTSGRIRAVSNNSISNCSMSLNGYRIFR